MAIRGHKEDFGKYGQIRLKNHVDWTGTDHRRSVAASLVKGVYVLESDRQRKEEGQHTEDLAPPWWVNFNFIHIENITDESDPSIIGAIFEYKPHNNPYPHNHVPPQSRPPKYVIAFRGTLLKYGSAIQDLYSDGKLICNGTTSRYQASTQVVQDKVCKVGLENVWITGHSLGAAIALQVGKTMAKQGKYIEAYLFNPPRISTPIKMLNNKVLETTIRMGKNIAITAVVKVINNKSSTVQEHDSFNMLRPWTPYLFVNPKDPICCEYSGYFEHRKRMEKKRVDWIQKKIERNDSIIGVLRKDGEALHQIPSAFIVMNDNSKGVHGICQWWQPHHNIISELYRF